MPTFGSGSASWRARHPGPPLPGWLNSISLEVREINFGLVMAWTHKNDEGSRDDGFKHESILNFPHSWNVHSGQDRRCVEGFLKKKVSDPPLRTLAMMHPLKTNTV